MKNLSLASVAGLALFAAASANAADIVPAYKAPPRVAAPVPLTWTGFYLGGHIGGGWGQKIWTEPPGSLITGSGGGGPINTTGMVDADGPVSGFLGGVQAGFNLQLSPRWVAGIEVDTSWADIKGGFPCFNGVALIKAEPSSDSCSSKSDMLGTIVARLGLTVGNAWVYLLGGGAWIHDRYTDNYFFPDRYDNFVVGYSARETRRGWTAGGGIEYAVDANWSAKVQYNYMDFGTRQLTFRAPGGDPRGDCPCSYPEDIQQRIHAIKVGINYRLGSLGLAPVVARY